MAIRELGYVVIETADLAKWDFYMRNVVGVMRAENLHAENLHAENLHAENLHAENLHAENLNDSAAHYRIDDRPFRFRIEKGAHEQLTAAAYRLDSKEALGKMAEAIGSVGRGVTFGSEAQARARSVDAFFHSTDPAGNGLEFYIGDTRDTREFVSPIGVSGFVTGNETGDKTGNLGMGHVVFNAPNFDEVHSFYRDVVGFHDTDIPRFKFSDNPNDPGMGFAFMHADNGRHHSIAIGEAPVPPSRCVHLMLEMRSLMDVGRCYDRMRLANVPISATLGRHTNDEMHSFYMQTPAGFDLEIGCDGLVIDPSQWEPTAHQTISQWGHVWTWQLEMEKAAREDAQQSTAQQDAQQSKAQEKVTRNDAR